MNTFNIIVLHMAAFFALCAAPFEVSAQARPMWITAYYPWWYYNQMPVEEVDFSLMTHVVVFSANPSRTPPYLDVLVNARDSANVVNGVDCGRPGDYLRQLVRRAHEKGVKVVLSVGGIWGEGADAMHYIAGDDARIETFVRASCAFARRWNLDGIELDWEFPQFADKWRHNKLIYRFRSELDGWTPRGIFIAAVHESPLPAYDKNAMCAAFDQINPMTYELYRGDYSKNLTGYNGPIEQSSRYAPYIGTSINQKGHGPRSWIDDGYPASKIGLSVSFTTTVFTGVEPPVEPSRPYKEHQWGNVRDIPRRGRHWDHSSQVPWFADGTTFISYEDTASSRLKVEYARALGLGGVMVYELGAGYLPSEKPGRRDVLLQAVSRAARSTTRPLGDLTPKTADREAPKVSILSPKDRARVTGPVTFKADAKDNRGVAALRFFIDGVAYGSVSEDVPAVSPPLNTWRLSNGTHTIRAEAVDDANNKGSAQITITVANSGAPPSFEDLVVYDEKLRAPFIDASWGVKNSFADVSHARTGSRAIKVEYGAHGALWLQHGAWGEEQKLYPTDYTELAFDAFPSESFTLEIVFSNNTSETLRLEAGKWNSCAVPVTGSGAFTKFYFRRDLPGSATVYYDNIRLKAAQPLTHAARGK